MSAIDRITISPDVCGGDVFGLEKGIVSQDLFPRRARGEEIEHVLHTNAKPTNARAATVMASSSRLNRPLSIAF